MKHLVLISLIMYSSFLLPMDYTPCTVSSLTEEKKQVDFIEALTCMVKMGEFDRILSGAEQLKSLEYGELIALCKNCNNYIKTVDFVREISKNKKLKRQFDAFKTELQDIAANNPRPEGARRFEGYMLDINVLQNREKQRHKNTNQIRKYALEILEHTEFDKEKQFEMIQEQIQDFSTGKVKTYLSEQKNKAVLLMQQLTKVELEVWERSVDGHYYTPDGVKMYAIYKHTRRVPKEST